MAKIVLYEFSAGIFHLICNFGGKCVCHTRNNLKLPKYSFGGKMLSTRVILWLLFCQVFALKCNMKCARVSFVRRSLSRRECIFFVTPYFVILLFCIVDNLSRQNTLLVFQVKKWSCYLVRVHQRRHWVNIILLYIVLPPILFNMFFYSIIAFLLYYLSYYLLSFVLFSFLF